MEEKKSVDKLEVDENNLSINNPIPTLHEHIYIEEVIPATCKEKGYTLHKCACGYEYRDNYTNLVDHKYELVNTVDATCEEDGYNEYACTICGKTKNEKIPALGHSYTKLIDEVPPSCVEDGHKDYECERCGKLKTEVLPAKGHDFGKWIEQVHPTCTEKGKTARQCKTCGVIEEKDLSPLGHEWERGKQVEEYDYLYTCTRCGRQEILTDKIAKKQARKDFFVKTFSFDWNKKVIATLLDALIYLVLAIVFFIQYLFYEKNTLFYSIILVIPGICLFMRFVLLGKKVVYGESTFSLVAKIMGCLIGFFITIAFIETGRSAEILLGIFVFLITLTSCLLERPSNK